MVLTVSLQIGGGGATLKGKNLLPKSAPNAEGDGLRLSHENVHLLNKKISEDCLQ